MTNHIKFRPMTPDDAAAVEIVEKASFKVPWSRESFFREAQNELTAYRVAVIEIDGTEKIVAYVGCWVIGDEAQIMNVAVLPDWRRQGLGKKLLDDLIADVKQHGAARMTLEVRPSNEAALKLYSSLGFQDCGRRPRYYDDGEDAIIMWKFDL